MGKLRNFFIEPEDPPMEVDNEDVTYFDSDLAEADTEGVTQENFINDIYENNELSDVSRSVFKVEELIKSLPKEMPTETKKTTVHSILQSFGLTVNEIISDADKRISIITAALKSVSEENSEVIFRNEKDIELKKTEISELEKDTSKRKEFISDSEEKAKEEIERIQSLKDFVYQEEK